MKYIVDVVKSVPNGAYFNAMKKAPADVLKTLESIGAVPKFIRIPDNRLFSVIGGIFNTLRIALKLQSSDELYIQGYGYYISLLVKIAKIKHVRLNYIVHDLTFLRFGNTTASGLEVSLLESMDTIFVHTDAMANVVKNKGIEGELRIMHLFDYYSDDAMIDKFETLSMKNVIAFAGNLEKSVFLQTLSKCQIPSTIQYRLYGLLKDKSITQNTQISYLGAFKPNQTGIVKAGWGLLWDGDSIDTCSGRLGEYLKINSSHKISLYLACGMPVILWRQSSLAKWLSDKGVCVLIDSLSDIPNAVNGISEDKYSEMVDNARNLGEMLRQGALLKSLLK